MTQLNLDSDLDVGRRHPSITPEREWCHFSLGRTGKTPFSSSFSCWEREKISLSCFPMLSRVWRASSQQVGDPGAISYGVRPYVRRADSGTVAVQWESKQKEVGLPCFFTPSSRAAYEDGHNVNGQWNNH